MGLKIGPSYLKKCLKNMVYEIDQGSSAERGLLKNKNRWHNHLDPNLKKDSWSEREEKILFEKHGMLGNRWSEIAAFLPGRSDNCIKNHFYSKLRKLIRKILKQMVKENLFKTHGIDQNVYHSEKIYRLIKKYRTPYKSLSKDVVIDLIYKCEKNLNTEGMDKTSNKNKKRKRKNKIKNRNLSILQGKRKTTVIIKKSILKDNPELKTVNEVNNNQSAQNFHLNLISPSNMNINYEIDFRLSSQSPLNLNNLYFPTNYNYQIENMRNANSPNKIESKTDNQSFNFDSNMTPINYMNYYQGLTPNQYANQNFLQKKFLQTPQNFFPLSSPREINIQHEQILIHESEFISHPKNEKTLTEYEAKSFFINDDTQKEIVGEDANSKKCKYFSGLNKKKFVPEIKIENEGTSSKIFLHTLSNSVENVNEIEKNDKMSNFRIKNQVEKRNNGLNISPASAFYKPKKHS